MGSVAGKRCFLLVAAFFFLLWRAGGDGVVLGIGVGMIDSGCWDIVGHRVSSKRAVPGVEDVGIVGA